MDKGGLQLLPENRKRIDVKIPGENNLVYTGIALVVVILVAYAGLWFYSTDLTTKLADGDTQIMELEKSRDKKAEQNLITLSKQISIINQLMKSHVYWSTGLSKIESALQGNVQFKSMSAVLGENTIHIRALSDNYSTIAKQLAAFVADDSIKDVTLDGVNSLTNGKLDFNAKVSFDRVKFLKAPQ
jgi:hypothetical protein